MATAGLGWVQWIGLVEIPVLIASFGGMVWFLQRALAQKQDSKAAAAFAAEVAKFEARQHAENEKLWRKIEGLQDDSHQIALAATEIRTLVEAIRVDIKDLKGADNG